MGPQQQEQARQKNSCRGECAGRFSRAIFYIFTSSLNFSSGLPLAPFHDTPKKQQKQQKQRQMVTGGYKRAAGSDE